MSSVKDWMPTQEERKEATRTAILDVAEVMFGDLGYEDTSTDAVAAKADVAKGSVYKHFPTKRDLFAAVFERVSAGVATKAAAAAANQSDILKAMIQGVEAFFLACAEPKVSQIMLRDGPGVLGWEDWRARDAAHFGGLVRLSLEAAMAAKAIRTQPIEPLTQMMLGAFQAASIDCAASDDFDVTAKHYLAVTKALLNGLK